MLTRLVLTLNAEIRIELDAAHDCLLVTWLRQPGSAAFRENVQRMADFAAEFQIRKALFDIRLRSYISISDQNWLLRQIMPRLSEHCRRIAYLTTTRSLLLMDTYNIREAVARTPGLDKSLEVELFVEAADAWEWLQETPGPVPEAEKGHDGQLQGLMAGVSTELAALASPLEATPW